MGHCYSLAGPASKEERQRAVESFREPMPEGLSLGEFLVRIPQMLEWLALASVQTRALVWAAADWQRVGAGDVVGRECLRSVWRAWPRQARC